MFGKLFPLFLVIGFLMGCGGGTSFDEEQGATVTQASSVITSPAAEPTAHPSPPATETPVPLPTSTPEPTAITFPLLDTVRFEEEVSAEPLTEFEPVWLNEPGGPFLLLNESGEALYQVALDSASGEWVGSRISPVQIDADGRILLWDNDSFNYTPSDAPSVAEEIRTVIADKFIAEIQAHGDAGHVLLGEDGDVVLIYESDTLGWEQPGTEGEVVERNGRFFVWQDRSWVPAGLSSEQIAAALDEDDIAWPLGRPTNYTTNMVTGILSDIAIEDVEIYPGELVRIHGLLSYLDIEGRLRQVKVPIWIEHLDMMTNHVFLNAASGTSPYRDGGGHYEDESLRRHVLEEMQYPFKYPVKVWVSFGVKSDLSQLYFGSEELFPLINGMHPEGFSEFRVGGDPASLGNDAGWFIHDGILWIDPDLPDMDTIIIPDELQPLEIYNYWPNWHNLPNASEFALIEGDYKLRYLVRYHEDDSLWHLEEARPIEIADDGSITYWDEFSRNFSNDLAPLPPELMPIVENEKLVEARKILRLHEEGYNVVDGFQLINSEGQIVLELIFGEDGSANWKQPDDSETSP